MSKQQIANVAPPGVILRREMESRGWSQSDLAEILGRPIQAVNQILKGKKGITPATARELEDAMTIAAEFWLNLESRYKLSLQEGRDNAVADRGELFSRTPVADLRRRGWIRDSRDVGKLKADVLRLLRIKSLSEPPQLGFAARMNSNYGRVTPGQEAWCCRAFEVAEGLEGIPRFSKNRLGSSLGELRKLGRSKESVTRIPDALRELGIRFLVLEHLPRTKIDGATFWLSKTRPVVVLSLRYGRIDYFLFTIFHELMHVLHEDALSVDNDILKGAGEEDIPECEARANEEAGALLVPRDELNRFVRTYRGRIGKADIIRFSSRIGIHPGVVLGQLQHREAIGWSACRELLEPIRESIVGVAVTDGWGNRQKR